MDACPCCGAPEETDCTCEFDVFWDLGDRTACVPPAGTTICVTHNSEVR
jgi:hypothetical protein